MEGLPPGMKNGSKYYESTSIGVKAIGCLKVASHVTGMCAQCEFVSLDQAFKRRAANHKMYISCGSSPCMRITYSTSSEGAIWASRMKSARISVIAKRYARMFDKHTFSRKSMENLHLKLQKQLYFNEYPVFVTNLIKAWDNGLLCRQNRPFICDLLTGISTSLVHGQSKRRVLSPNEKAFYKMLLMYGGKMVHNFVSLNLLGPSHDTSRAELRHLPYLGMNSLSKNVTAVVALLEKYHLLGVPCLIGEDGSAILKQLDPSMEPSADGSDEMVVVVYGMNGGPVVVTSASELKDRFNAHGFATTLYVWDLIPLIDKAPHFPIKVATNANSFSHLDVLREWKGLWRMCHEFGINIVGHVSDGDPKLRAADFMLQQNLHRSAGAAADYVDVDHHLIQIRVPVVSYSGNHGDKQARHPVCCLQDFLHVMWRLRVMYLKPHRTLLIGPFLVSPENIRRHMREYTTDMGLRYSDLNERDKQNFAGCLRLFGFNKDGSVKQSGDTTFEMLRPDDGMMGDILYLRFCHRFVRTFLVPTSEVDPLSSVVDMGYTITFLALWRQLVVEGTSSTLKDNFLSRETYTDVLLTAMTVVVLVKVYRDFYPQYPWVPRRFSSRFNEYLFAYLRLQLKGTPNFTALTARRHLRNLMGQLNGQAHTDLKFPQFKRGHTRASGRADFEAGKQLVWPTDDEIIAALDTGTEECKAHFREPFNVGNSLWNTLQDKALENYTLFNPKSEAFWKEASRTQLSMATDGELGTGYITQVQQGFHLPNDWRAQFAETSGIDDGDDFHGGGVDGAGGNCDVDHGEEGAAQEDSGKVIQETGTRDDVILNRGTYSFTERAAALNVGDMNEDCCSCATSCGLTCSNYLRGWDCTTTTCVATKCGYRQNTRPPPTYTAECAVKAKGLGLFLKYGCRKGTRVLRLGGGFHKAVPQGKRSHYTLSFGDSCMPEGTPKRGNVFVVSGVGRCINTGCKPNAEFRVMRSVRGAVQVWVVATCDVKPGGEVVSAYTLQNATKCLCDDCEKGRSVQLVGANEVAVQCDKKVDEEVDDDGDGDDDDADAEVKLVDDKQHLKFEKALLKCVKVANGTKFASTQHSQDTRTPLFMKIQDICKTLNSNVDTQAKDRKFRFAQQLCIEAGEVRDAIPVDGEEGSDGYISVDDDVAYLFEDDPEEGGERMKHTVYYGCIAGITLLEQNKSRAGIRREYTHRVGSLKRLKATGVALIHWYETSGVDEAGNTLVDLIAAAPEAMSTDGIICCVKLEGVGTDRLGNHRFRLAKAAADDHAEIIHGYDTGEIPKGAALKASRRTKQRKRNSNCRTLAQLRAECRDKGLPLYGNKAALTKRLKEGDVPKRVSYNKGKRLKRKAAPSPCKPGSFSWGPSHFLGKH